MAEKISPEEVRHTAQLARILLSGEEVSVFTEQLGKILTYMEKLNELNTEGVEPLAHVLPLTNVLRPDQVGPSIGSELAVREAPDRKNGFFRVPKVLGGDNAP